MGNDTSAVAFTGFGLLVAVALFTVLSLIRVLPRAIIIVNNRQY
jgi:hypothetical protein